MIAGFHPTAYFPFHARRDEHLRRTGIQQEMVDTYAGIASVRIAEIVPESVDRFLGVELPDGIGPSVRQELLIGGTRLRQKESIVHPPLRLIRIYFCGYDIVVPSKNHCPVFSEEPLRIGREPFEP